MENFSDTEIEGILKDLIEYKKVADILHAKGGFKISPFATGKSEKKKEFYQGCVDILKKLVDGDKVTSCYITQLVKQDIKGLQKVANEPYDIFNSPRRHLSSEELKTKTDGISLNQLIELAKNILGDSSSKQDIKKFNTAIKDFGTCYIYANEEVDQAKVAINGSIKLDNIDIDLNNHNLDGNSNLAIYKSRGNSRSIS